MVRNEISLHDRGGGACLRHLSLFSFILAAVTGFGYRLGLLGMLPYNLGLENIRHAHSHLMFFGWAVPFPLYILYRQMIAEVDCRAAGAGLMKNSILCCLIFGLLAYPFFLIYGYRPVPVGAASLPLSVIISGLVMMTWYSFGIGYLKIRAGWASPIPRAWFDASLLLLFICSLGAWGVAVLQAIDPNNQLFAKVMTHFFLATFTEGWVVLVSVAILLYKMDIKREKWILNPHIPLGCIALGAPMTFPYGISESLLTTPLLTTARLGGLLAAAGLSLVVYHLFRFADGKKLVWIWPVGLLGVKALMQLAGSLIPAAFWLSDHGLRILYLHVLLLGGLSLTVVGWLHTRSNAPLFYFRLVTGSVLTVLLSLILLTRFWPVVWSGSWLFYAVAGAALLPALSISAEWIKISSLKTQ